jgi:hypothetical protein
MKKQITLFVVALIATNGNLFAQLTFSGFLDSSVSLRAGAGDAPAFSYGIEEYANLRMQARVRDKAVFYGAFNFVAAAGDYAAGVVGLAGKPVGEIIKYIDDNGEEKEAYIINGYYQKQGYIPAGISPSAFIAGENYIAGIELERLYLRLNGETVDFDGGLLRLPFGYGQVWGPSDFLNPRNPLLPDARPRAVLGVGLSWYPKDELKLLAFGAAPRNPFMQKGEGVLAGIALDHHWTRASMQLLYSFETPQAGSRKGFHRAGLSVKADLEVGLVMDLLYTYNNIEKTKFDGLSFSFGADYSFFDGDLIVLAEYLFNGKASSTAFDLDRNIFGRNNRHYLYTGLTWRFNDFTNINAALVSCFDDVSFTPVLSLNHDLFQGATLTLTAQIPLDRDLFSGNSKRGELGPDAMGCHLGFNAKVRLRF